MLSATGEYKMNITKEKFNKLKQLDRIEYRQRKSLIEEQYSGCYVFYSIRSLLIIYAVIMIVYLNLYQIDEERGEELIKNILDPLRACTFGLIIVSILFDIISVALRYEHTTNLDKEFFEVNVK